MLIVTLRQSKFRANGETDGEESEAFTAAAEAALKLKTVVPLRLTRTD
jgi:hypothetical protein